MRVVGGVRFSVVAALCVILISIVSCLLLGIGSNATTTPPRAIRKITGKRNKNQYLYNPSILKTGEESVRLSRFNYCTKWHFNTFTDTFVEDAETVVTDKFGRRHTIPKSEDLRLFVMNGKPAGIYTRVNQKHLINQSGFSRTSMSLCTFDPFREVQLHYAQSANVEKNWMPFEHGNALYVSYSVNPHVVLAVDATTGLCVHTHATTSDKFKRAGELRGGSPWVPITTPRGRMCLTVVHWVKRMPTWPFRKYYHAFVLMRHEPPFPVVHVGQEFRFEPEFHDARDWIQFCAGMFIKDGRIYLSYGVSDCVARVAYYDLAHITAQINFDSL